MLRLLPPDGGAGPSTFSAKPPIRFPLNGSGHFLFPVRTSSSSKPAFLRVQSPHVIHSWSSRVTLTAGPEPAGCRGIVPGRSWLRAPSILPTAPVIDVEPFLNHALAKPVPARPRLPGSRTTTIRGPGSAIQPGMRLRAKGENRHWIKIKKLARRRQPVWFKRFRHLMRRDRGGGRRQRIRISLLSLCWTHRLKTPTRGAALVREPRATRIRI
jgi:hypothetical protein